MYRLKSAVIAVALSCLAGCASFVVPSYSADYSAVDALKRSGLKPVAVEPVQPQDSSAKVNKITLRGAQLTVDDGNYAKYLERALQSDLKEAGLFDPASNRRLFVTLLRNDIDVSGFSEGTGDIQAEVAVNEQGQTRLRKTYTANTKFESSFAGAVAIPKGQAEYPNLVRSLLAQIYRDPEMLAALKP